MCVIKLICLLSIIHYSTAFPKNNALENLTKHELPLQNLERSNFLANDSEDELKIEDLEHSASDSKYEIQTEVHEDSLVFGYHFKHGIPMALELARSEMLRIVGGSQVSKADAVPYQAGIVVRLTSGHTSICGGSLISNTRVLTAAHCWWDGQGQARTFTIVLGSLTIFSGGTRIETSNVSVHPQWAVKLLYDLAVARITSVAFNNNIQAIPLPALADVNKDFVGLTGLISGYGKTTDAQTSFPATTSLHSSNVAVITNSVCQNSFTETIHGSHLCTSGSGKTGTCDGDSGGPLTVVYNNRRTLIGVVAFGPPVCESGLPSVYTRVTTFLNWIQAQ